MTNLKIYKSCKAPLLISARAFVKDSTVYIVGQTEASVNMQIFVKT